MKKDHYEYNLDYDGLYSSLESALSSLYERRKSSLLEKIIHTQLDLTDELTPLISEPHLIIFRQVATPIHEILKVFDIAKKVGIKPFIIEYYDDKFVSTGNQYKRGLGKLPILDFINGNDEVVYNNRTVVDFNKYTGKKLKEVVTVNDEPLVDFHHDLFNRVTGLNVTEHSADASDWFHKFGTAENYYKHYLRLFIRDAILFEILIVSEVEEEFTKNVINPAFQIAVDTFGHRPLIVRTVEKIHEHDTYWDCYPKDVNAILTSKSYNL